MDFSVSSKFKVDGIGPVSTGSGASINTSRISQYAEMDYSDSADDNSTVDSSSILANDPTLFDVYDAWTVGDDLLQGINKFISSGKIGNKNAGQFIVDKGYNAGFWALSKGTVESFFEKFGVGKAGADAIYKPIVAVFSAIILGKEINWRTDVFGNAGAGLFKAAGSAYFKELFVEKLSIENAFKKVGLFGFEKIGALLNNVDSELLKFDASYLKVDQILGHAGKIGAAIGIDYAASLLSNMVKGIIADGDLSWADMKFGSTFLKSSTKEIFGYIGNFVGGPGGKVIGTAVGAFLGELQVAVFTDENGKVDEKWCAIAGGTQIAGAVAGSAFAIFCLTNPGVWAIAGCIAAGAVVGFLVTAISYHFDAVVDAISTAAVAVGEWFSNAIDVTCAWITDKYESVVAFATDILETGAVIVEGAVEFLSDIYDGGKELLSDIYDGGKELFSDIYDAGADLIEDLGDAVQANPVTDFLFGWIF